MSEPWWRSAVVYQIYPRSFCDSDGDGVGDLEGIRRHLDHLVWLGVDALWLSPVFSSPMVDHGYDVSDYCDIDPLFGSLADMDRLIDDAHGHGLRVVLDWVPNHTSDRHPWFVESRSSRDAPTRDWYVWRDGRPATGAAGEVLGPDGSRPPNDWPATFPAGPAWTFDDRTGQWYLHLFTPEQPDLDWRNPEVVAAMHDTLRFWLDRGVDGFRMDVVHMIGKDPDAPERPPRPGDTMSHAIGDEPLTHQRLREIRSVIDSYDGDRMAVGEVYLLDAARVATFYGDGDELHQSFWFEPLFTPWRGEDWTRRLADAEAAFFARDVEPAWVLNNHDLPRFATRAGVEKAPGAAVLLLSLPGSAYLYAGEELGLEDADVPAERREDPAGFRDGCRAPIPWTADADHGWTGPDPWLPWPPDADRLNAETARSTPGSMAHLYRRLIAARRSSPALHGGSLRLLDAPGAVVAYERRHRDGDRRAVLINTGAAAAHVDLDGAWTVEVSSDGPLDGARFDGGLPPRVAVVLRPV